MKAKGQQLPRNNAALLSPCEAELLTIITEGLRATGFSDEEVAARMDMAVGTVRAHISRIYQKLQVAECSRPMQNGQVQPTNNGT